MAPTRPVIAKLARITGVELEGGRRGFVVGGRDAAEGESPGLTHEAGHVAAHLAHELRVLHEAAAEDELRMEEVRSVGLQRPREPEREGVGAEAWRDDHERRRALRERVAVGAQLAAHSASFGLAVQALEHCDWAIRFGVQRGGVTRTITVAPWRITESTAMEAAMHAPDAFPPRSLRGDMFIGGTPKSRPMR